MQQQMTGAPAAVCVAFVGLLTLSPDRLIAAERQAVPARPAVGARSRASSAEGPPAPTPPAVVSRDEKGNATVRAIRLAEPLRLDGVLDEAVYQTVPPLGGFIQAVPNEGAPSTERTDAWIMFDSANIYIAARCWDSASASQWVANEMRRDTAQLRQNDTFGVMFDTFHDQRSGNVFYTNPLGARADFAYTDETNINPDWNPVWDVRTGRFEGGWTVEMTIPFKSIRYHSGKSQAWGLQLRRGIRRKNEWAYLTPVPAATGSSGGGISRNSSAGTLVGLDLPPASRNIEVKPYAISRVSTDHLLTPPVINNLDGDIGIDVKYGVTANLTADLTYNTDFAQVEVDEQQVNLTRFNLFYPEKREFFLEGRGTMDFGRGIVGAGADVPFLYYSRRIGLNANRVIPIEVGGRLTGKVGRFGLGLMNIRTDSERLSATPATDFTVLRVRRDILRRSSVGAMFTNRSPSSAGGSNQAYGADAVFAFFSNLSTTGYLARTHSPGREGDDMSSQARIDYTGDRYGASVQHLHVGNNFNPEVGFVRRRNFRRSFASARFSPRPRRIKAVRKFTWESSVDYVLNGAGQLETRELLGRFNTELENSDQLTLQGSNHYELLIRPFPIPTAPAVIVPVGSYRFSDAQVSYAFGQQRRASGTLTAQQGRFYNGTITALSYTAARVSVMKPLSVEPTLSINRVDLPAGRFTTTQARARTDYAFTPRMFVSALLQYSSADRSFSSNMRFRWEYRPGSELFVVYTDERDTEGTGYSGPKNRAFVLKINRLLRF